MFGTNWPMISSEHCLKAIDSLELSPEQHNALLSGNARRVFEL